METYDVLVTYRGPVGSTGVTLQAFGSSPLKIVDGPKPLPYSTNVSQPTGANRELRGAD